ncbi:L-threonylcarbamoyladenylate synthase [Actimicrobium sp. CCI2.3]|uniref:L-threonylcarbamoyladenylate synthase n=1 Tax=Actimicrobium sp. CCI2.3 TaxID=3048616 RepID=UPI002AB51046|nr:L-threonylcarbamoyladenylate synthase [Actimicrobium sp. CCI2.3]MDY7575977.1 L-threonylcarbamoyladenylate synthase [Actimicrobium sp. CCI2.3]MEB0023290.1 L-threonylcarbamoyladenylate synthase [Actimicrobium sp. CCI2.3]
MSLPLSDEIDRAAHLLEQGRLVAFPTETVYGLGADAENPAAIARIYAAKGRPSNHPVIVHLAPEADLAYWVSAIPTAAQSLIDAFWPGPLTLILPRAAHIPAAVAGGQNSIGVRCPSHPVAQALLRAFKGGMGGIAAPSANKFGHVSPTLAQHVRDEFADGSVDLILDGGQSEVGIESSILDLSRLHTHGPVLLRPGRITALQLADVLGVAPAAPDAAAPRASGTLEAHYAPQTPVAMVASAALPQVLQQLAAAGRRVVLLHWSDSQHADALQLPSSPAGYAHGLYAGLRVLDAASADVILIEAPPHSADWQAVNDRLRRAAYDSTGILERLL